MLNFQRVKDKSTGDEYSARRPDLNKVEVLDEPAVDANGRPLPGKPKTVAADGDSYSDMKVADLRAEVESRNADRDEAAKISANGNKAVLVSALEADDEAKPDEGDDSEDDEADGDATGRE